MQLNLHCGLATADAADHIVLAEHLGYTGAWMLNSPAIYADPWIALGRAADRTKTIELGVSVIVPHLRHIVDTANALVSLDASAPGRVCAAVGSGFTSTALLGRPNVRWAQVERFVADLRSLLAGHEIEVDGHLTGLLHGTVSGYSLPIRVPIWIAAHGPKGHAVAERVGDGVMTNLEHGGRAVPINGRFCTVVYGTVVDDGMEDFMSERVLDAAGPAAALALHLGEHGPLAGSDEVDSYVRGLAEVSSSRQHLEMHRGHLIELTALDRTHVTERLIRTVTMTGTVDEVRGGLRRLEEAGVTDVLYVPTGRDIPRELDQFAAAAA